MFGPRFRQGGLKSLPVARMVPNMITLLALCAGMTSVRLALMEEWDRAVLAIVVAAVLDALDGRIARLLRGTTRFGAELDSLSDFVSFGCAPAVVLYLWSLHAAASVGWAVALLFSIAMALRLARFNTMLGDPDEPPAWAASFFVGIPAPAAAGLALWPMIAGFAVEPMAETLRHPIIVGPLMVAVAALMVSRVPTFSFKRFRVPGQLALPVMLGMAVVAAFAVTNPAATLAVLLLLYLATIPFSVRAFRKRQAAAEG
ncbi:CDP-alcohol phosphatidyltransferase family protein [Roseospirillum parvum]|uniref:CDP-diacylglycerol---serine O-phosphatidyltransferase n=1 Tax=Roseospirillum parvum TaxID=83401 RepID=A0A1G8FHV4_9PROT|nr:CDP-alcohol phosphatidyltransferase family protein [Roseospirillum parvum]SDH81713.1 CDP-diacylglycerol---serine O-phosphatidyltransferase [Roseospirillum parvum]